LFHAVSSEQSLWFVGDAFTFVEKQDKTKYNRSYQQQGCQHLTIVMMESEKSV
jgi:hypothetical protein